jgi:hypothetical protein
MFQAALFVRVHLVSPHERSTFRPCIAFYSTEVPNLTVQPFSLTPLLLVDCLSAMIFRDRSAALMDECLHRNILPVTVNYLFGG